MKTWVLFPCCTSNVIGDCVSFRGEIDICIGEMVFEGIGVPSIKPFMTLARVIESDWVGPGARSGFTLGRNVVLRPFPTS